jgi:hypothetical protein
MLRFLFKAADSLVQTRLRMIYSCVLAQLWVAWLADLFP